MGQRSKTNYKPQRGATGIAYGLLVGLIGVVALSSVQTIGDETVSLFDTVSTDLAGGESCDANSASGGYQHGALNHRGSTTGVISGNPGTPPADAASWQSEATITCSDGTATAGSAATVITSCNIGFTLSGNACVQDPATIADIGSGVRGWSDGSFAISCKGYLDGSDNASASGDDAARIGITSGNASDSVTYRIDPDGSGGAAPYNVQCEMAQAGGGWTLVATVADDNNNFWTWNNQAALYTGNNTTGSLATWQTNDFQSLAWTTVTGDETLFQASSSASKWIRYTSILSNEAMVDKYSAGNVTVGEFAAAESSGSWFQLQGSTFQMYLQRDDCDSHGWADEAAKGFVFRSENGDFCGYDDLFGAQGRKNVSNTENSSESNWNRTQEFYFENFENGAMYVYVR